ncbi:phage tail tape measure protein [Streptomyces hydrogenans]|uniref:hypothetical protein n=1 Tax=Streptomyces hydrogenans TaxID=1873719 RepID=UPI0038192ADA
MALTVGELVGIIRADDSGWRSGLDAARLRLRGLTRDAEGRLRDMRGRFISEGEQSGEGLGRAIQRGSLLAVSALKKIGPAAAGIGIGIPAVAALTTAIAGLAAGAVAAGLAVGAFQLAVKPQMESMKGVADAAEALAKAEEDEARKGQLAARLTAEGSDLAGKATKAYTTARLKTREAELAYQRSAQGIPKATRDAAIAQAQLRIAHEEWSESLAGTTMPVFTKGLTVLKNLLPVLTPFVKAAAGALDDMLNKVAKGIQSARFKEWAADMAEASGPALSNFIQIIANLGRGFMGLMQAFLPTSDGITGGLVGMTDAFADWAQGLKDSEGFAKFLDIAKEGGGALGTFALAMGNLLVAISPLIGVTAEIALSIAEIINAMPPDVLAGIAAGVTAVALAFKAYQLWGLIAAGVSLILESRLWVQIGLWLAVARTAILSMLSMARAAIVHAATVAAAWLGSALRAVGSFALAVARAALAVVGQMAMMAARAIAWAATMAAQWLIAMGPIGWILLAVGALVTAIIVYWDEIKAGTLAAWEWIVTTVTGLGRDLLNWFVNWQIWAEISKHWQAIKTGTRAMWDGLMAWIKGIPGRIVSYFSGWQIGSTMSSHWQRAKEGAIKQGQQLLKWVYELPGAILKKLGNLGSLLIGVGKDVVRGLWEGIRAMGGWIKSKVGEFARNVIPGPIADILGIASPSKVTKEQGRWIALGLVEGLLGSAKDVAKASMKVGQIVQERMKAGSKKSALLKRIEKDSKNLIRLANAEAAVATKLKAATKSLDALVKARAELSNSVKKGILEAADITANVGEGGVTASSILANLQSNLAQAKKFAQDLAALRAKGLRSDLIAQIAQAGVEQGSATAAALAAASSGQIKQINTTQEQLVTAATQAGTTAGDAMYGAGIRAAQGLVEGLKAQQSAIEKQMVQIALGMQKAIKSALGIKSPSRVMAALGRFIPAGLVRGIEAGRPAVDASMSSLATPPVLPRMAGAGTGAGGGYAGRTGGPPVVVEFKSSGTARGDYLVQELRAAVQRGGGDVQVVLGQRR